MAYLYSNNKKIYCKDTGETTTGDKYLQSKHWKLLRIKVYEHFNGECQRCKSAIPLEQAVIHHRTYKRFGNEHLNDLILYCKSCHTAIHKNKKQWHETNKDIQFYIKQLTDIEKKKVIDYIEKYIFCTKNL